MGSTRMRVDRHPSKGKQMLKVLGQHEKIMLAILLSKKVELREK